jgi:hypothetical protein
MDRKEPIKTDFRDMGIIVALTLIFFGLRQTSSLYIEFAFGALLIALIAPILYKPLTIAWFAIGVYLNKISSLLILTVVYVLVLVPVALLMRLAGRDLLKIKQFKKGKTSVFSHRNHRYTEENLMKPY